MEIILIGFGWILFVGVSLSLMAEAGRRNHSGDAPPPRPPGNPTGIQPLGTVKPYPPRNVSPTAQRVANTTCSRCGRSHPINEFCICVTPEEIASIRRILARPE